MSAFSLSARSILAALLFAGGAFPLLAAAQNISELRGKPSKDDIVRALAPSTQHAPRMRGLSLQTSEPAAAAKPAPQQKAVDLEILFEFNSDRLTNDGRDVLVQLGGALNSGELAAVKSIVLEGHTDARGSALYNKGLSLRRAQTVKNFLAQEENVPAAKLRAVGKGSTELADPNRPEDGVNRRVRVIVAY